MGTPVIVYGKSGCGKTRSLKNFLGSRRVAVIKCIDKPNPFRGHFDDELVSNDPRTILDFINKGIGDGIKSFVIDDMGYIQTAMFMRGHRNKSGASSFDLFNDIGDVYWGLMRSILNMPKDIIVYMMYHESANDYGECKIRTIGKLLDEKVCLEGLCTIVIHAIVDEKEHLFRVQASDNDIAKAPEDMFTSETIPNDLLMVDNAIREYYEI